MSRSTEAETLQATIDNVLDDIQAILMSLLVKLGPFLVALMPALFTAYAIYFTYRIEAGPTMALLFAIVVGLAMETVGIVSVHTAIQLYNAWQEGLSQRVKFRWMLALIPIYVVGVAGVVLFSGEAFTPLVKALGVASPFLTCIVYFAVALARDIHRTEVQQAGLLDRQAEVEAESREWEREKERIKMRDLQAAKLARIEAKKVSIGSVQQVQLPVQEGAQIGAMDTVNLSRDEKKRQLMDSLLDIYLDNPQASIALVAQRLGVVRQTVYNYLDELERDGIIRRNGDGIEVKR